MPASVALRNSTPKDRQTYILTSKFVSGGGYSNIDLQYLSNSGVTQNTATPAVSGTATQVVQVATVPFSPVIPINPMVTNLSVQLPSASTTEVRSFQHVFDDQEQWR